MKRNLFLGGVSGILSCAGLFAAGPAWAAFGDVDTTFGSTAVPGYQIHNLGGNRDFGIDLVTGLGDRLYVLGIACDGTTSNQCLTTPNAIVLTRYTADGDVDTTFGGNNTGDLPLLTNVHRGDYKIEVDDSDAQLYLAGINCTPICEVSVARADFQGNPDATYGDSGIATFPVTDSPALVQLLLQPNGKLLILIEHDFVDNANALTSTRFNIVRLNTDGTPDTSWGQDGTVDVSTQGGCDVGASMMLGRDPVIYVMAGKRASCAVAPAPVLWRYQPNGTLDPSFGSAGEVDGNFGQSTSDFFGLVAQEQPDKSIAYGIGNIDGQGVLTMDIVKLNHNGTRDTSFTAQHGTFTPLANFTPQGNAQFQSTGKLIFNGQFKTTPTNGDEGLVRIQGSPLFAHPPRFAPFLRFDTISSQVNENAGTATVKVELCAGGGAVCAPVTTAQAITVPFTLGGDATQGVDYTLPASICPPPGNACSVTIPAGASFVNIPVTIVDDTAEEFGETVLFNLGASSGGQNTTDHNAFILGIVDNDLSPHQAPEGDTGGAIELELLAGLFGLFGLRRLRARRH